MNKWVRMQAFNPIDKTRPSYEILFNVNEIGHVNLTDMLITLKDGTVFEFGEESMKRLYGKLNDE